MMRAALLATLLQSTTPLRCPHNKKPIHTRRRWSPNDIMTATEWGRLMTDASAGIVGGSMGVMGTLAVSRSIGDVGFKHNRHVMFANRTLTADLVISCPETARLPLPAEEDNGFVLVACDGLWDVLAEDKATAIAAALLGEGKTPREVAVALVERAVERGSMDNVSVCCLDLRNASCSC